MVCHLKRPRAAKKTKKVVGGADEIVAAQTVLVTAANYQVLKNKARAEAGRTILGKCK